MGDEPVNVKEYQELAKQALPKMYYDYFAGGSEDQHTLRENNDAFQRIISIWPRILVDVSKIDMSITILGYKTSAPIMIAPTAMHKLAHPGGEILTAKAAAACDVIMGLTFMSTCTIEEVASSCNAVRFFQLYDIAWLKSITKLPILIKGVLNHEDAAIKAVEIGVEGIIVSNHGACQLDYVPATIAVLEEVVGAVQGRIPVLFDGGIRRGTDVFKALALGAHAVMIGRPIVYGLAAKGEYGVRRVIEMLKLPHSQ
ncbi:hypothetical protein L1987_14539 [Smallanthus sonchifolius]|uniref:Uncharacterized protein n=1 Tax=Smallanthus sonchifolius TaxID=185202 RepID=A0ACB9J455_9ASTR|nr:hypothetical protein L1987_14539 [Smallanthus sonchifolius]